MRKVLSLLFAIGMILALTTNSLADEANYEVTLLGRLDNSIQLGGQDTYTVEFQIKTSAGYCRTNRGKLYLRDDRPLSGCFSLYHHTSRRLNAYLAQVKQYQMGYTITK